MKKSSFWRIYLPIVVVGVILAIIPPALGFRPFYLRLTTIMLVFMTYTVAYNIVFAHTRQLFLCMGALAGVSSYFSVILVRELGLPIGATIPIGVLAAGAMGSGLSYIAVRRGMGVIFLGVITIIFALVFHTLLYGLSEFTYGETGISTRGMGFDIIRDRQSAYYIFLAILLAALVGYSWLVRSRIGLAFRSLNDDELAARLAGIDVTRYKVLAAFIGCSTFGFVGALFGYWNGYIGPPLFDTGTVDVVCLVMLIFGGMGTLLGPILGGVVFTVVDDLVRPLGPLTLLVYGGILVILFIFFRQGMVVALQGLGKRLAARLPRSIGGRH